MSVKRDSFKNDNVFMLAGHGAEVLDRDLERYILGKNEYLAMYHIPGDVGVLGDISFYNNFYNDKRIDIPTAKDKYLVSKDYFGSLGGLKRARISDTIGPKAIIINNIETLINSYSHGLLYYNKPIAVKTFENFKLYHPRENDEELNYKNTAPNLIYQPGTFFINAALDNWIKEHFSISKVINFELKINPAGATTHINVRYKKVLYQQIVYDLGMMTLMKSGIMRKSLSPPTFKKTDIEDFDGAFKKIMEHGIHVWGTIPSPFDGVNDGVVTIFYPQNALFKTLQELISNKDKDPLAYDFLSWYKAAYNESIFTFDDVCLYAIAEIAVNSRSQPSRFKTFINTLIHLPNIISSWIPFKRFIPSELIKFIINSIPKLYPMFIMYIDSYFKKDLKPMYHSMTEIGDIFLDMKNKFDDNMIKSMSLALTMQDILHVNMNIETIYKFINLYGKTNGEPFMVVPLICRAPMGNQYLVDEKIKLSRPRTKTVKTKTKTKTKTRSKPKSLLKSLTRH